MENPLDTAGNAVKGAGELAGNSLFGIARFLEQVTGDAVSAAIFAAFLLFSLGLIKGAGVSRNSDLYSKAIRNVGIIGLLGYAMVSVVLALNLSTVTTEADILKQGLTGYRKGITVSFFEVLLSAFREYFWFGMVFLVMVGVGIVLSRISSSSKQ